MPIRTRFDHQLETLRHQVLIMGDMVQQQLVLAMNALDELDLQLADQVFTQDVRVNGVRYAIEQDAIVLIGTQQPMARDLRRIVTVMNIIVDLERMGDQAKGIVKVIPHMLRDPSVEQPPQLHEMAEVALRMHRISMQAFAQDDIELAQNVSALDEEVDDLYAKTFKGIMNRLTETQMREQVESTYEMLRVARELERYGDLVTNIAERVVYCVTGVIEETNLDREELSVKASVEQSVS